MFRKRGLLFIVRYFFNAHLFDIVNRTDTHNWLEKEYIKSQSRNFHHGVLYMPTWTNVIHKIFFFLKDNFNLNDYIFMDVGSGKGKVLLVWSKLLEKYRLDMRLVGIEYSSYLCKICEANLSKFSLNNVITIQNQDVMDIDFEESTFKYIFFLYNPFNKFLLNKFIAKISKLNYILVYVNGDTNLFKEHENLKSIKIRSSKFPHENFIIIRNDRSTR